MMIHNKMIDSSRPGKVAQLVEQRKHQPMRLGKAVHSNVNDNAC